MSTCLGDSIMPQLDSLIADLRERARVSSEPTDFDYGYHRGMNAACDILTTWQSAHPEFAPCDEWICFNGLCVIREPKKPDVRVHGKSAP